MIEIKLPFPPTALSPNVRQHWSRLAKAKKIYRQTCWAQTLQQHQGLPWDGLLTLELTFYKPSRRSMDRDNLLARMKSGLDGVCDALKIDDKRFDPVVVSVSGELGNFVRIRIFQGESNGKKDI